MRTFQWPSLPDLFHPRLSLLLPDEDGASPCPDCLRYVCECGELEIEWAQ